MVNGALFPWSGFHRYVGKHIYSDRTFEKCTVTVFEVVESHDPCIVPWSGAGVIKVRNTVVDFSIPVFEVLRALGEMPESEDAIEALLPYLNEDIDYQHIPERCRKIVERVMSKLITSGCFAATDIFHDEPVSSFLKMQYSCRSFGGNVYVLPDGRIFYVALYWVS